MRRRKGRGSPPIPGPLLFTATGWRPDRRSRSGRGRRPPRRRLPAFGAGELQPAPGADGTTVRASQTSRPSPTASRGRAGAARPKWRAGQGARGARPVSRIQCAPRAWRWTARPGRHPAGGARGGSSLPVELEGPGGSLLNPLENEPDRLRSAISKADGPDSLDLQRDALEAVGVDAGNVYCLDRLDRNLRHLVNTVQDLSARGVGLRVLNVLAGDGAQAAPRPRPAPRVRHLGGACRVRAVAAPGTHRSWAQGCTARPGAGATRTPASAGRDAVHRVTRSSRNSLASRRLANAAEGLHTSGWPVAS